MASRQSTLAGNDHEAQGQPLASPLKWAGGKRWLAPTISHFYEPFVDRRLVEPFCGGLAVALRLQPKRALLNDINPHLINFYRQLKKGLEIDIPLKNTAAAFDDNKARFNELVLPRDSKEAASLFYYLNRTCFNGLCRFNKAGKFNVPFGRYEKVRFVRDFSEYKVQFRHWEFENLTFEKLVVDDDDFLYVDPPYHVTFTQYSKEGFTWEDQKAVALRYATHPGPVVLSNNKTGPITQLYRKHRYDLHYRHAPRMISCDGDRTKAKEVLATRNMDSTTDLTLPTRPAPRLRYVLAV